MTNNRLTTAILLCILFTAIGWAAPVIVASHAPAGTYIDPVSLYVDDTVTGDSSHRACFTRTVSADTTGIVIRELVLVSDGQRIEVDSTQMRTYFQQGTKAVEVKFTLPPTLEPGQYQYMVAIEFDVGTTGVTRTQSIESNAFTVYPENHTINSTFTCTV